MGTAFQGLGASHVTRVLIKARKASCYQGTRGIQIHLHKSHAFHAFFPCFPCFPCFHFCKFPCFPGCFPWFSMASDSMLSMLSWGIFLQFSCSMLAWKFPHGNHGILLWLHAPWFSRESMEFSPCFFHVFSMDFPCFQY